jgi:hypothetical protein
MSETDHGMGNPSTCSQPAVGRIADDLIGEDVIGEQAIPAIFSRFKLFSPLNSLAHRKESLAKRARDRNRISISSQSAR